MGHCVMIGSLISSAILPNMLASGRPGRGFYRPAAEATGVRRSSSPNQRTLERLQPARCRLFARFGRAESATQALSGIPIR